MVRAVFTSQSRAAGLVIWRLLPVAIVCHRKKNIQSGNEQSYNVMDILYTLTSWFLPFLNDSWKSLYFRQAPSKSGQEREMETHCCWCAFGFPLVFNLFFCGLVSWLVGWLVSWLVLAEVFQSPLLSEGARQDKGSMRRTLQVFARAAQQGSGTQPTRFPPGLEGENGFL